MNVTCSAQGCPILLNSLCVIYEGESLLYTGITTNDTLQTALQKIDAKFHDAGLGYIFTNGLTQTVGQPVKLGGTLIENTTITNNSYYLQFTGTVKAAAFVTTGGTNVQFVKGDGSLDNTSYQTAGAYITALSGDASATGPGNAIITLATVNGNVGTFGTSTTVPTITVNEKGLVTSVTSTAINIPWPLLTYIGDVTGLGYPGTQITLTLNSVNPNVITSSGILKLTVNAKGLVTSAVAANASDIFSLIGYTPVAPTRTISINGISQDLSANRTWSVGTLTNISVVAGSGISASVTDPTGAPTITITNLAPDQIVNIVGGVGISVTGTYPNFTITNTGGGGSGGGSGTVTSVGLSMPSAFAVANSPITGGGVLTVTGVGNSGQYIDGLGALQTFPSISGISGFPLQAGNGGKYLTTNGSVLSWSTITTALSTLADVQFGTLSTNDILSYNLSTGKWENKTISTVLGYTPANDLNVVHTTGNETVNGIKTFTSNIIQTSGNNTFNTLSGTTFIGYPAPVVSSFKLDVNGNARFTGVFIPNNNYLTFGYNSTSPNASGFGLYQDVYAKFSVRNFNYGYDVMTFVDGVVPKVGIGANMSNVDDSAILEIASTTQGFLPPRMTSAQRTAIVNPAIGLIVYQTDGLEGLYEKISGGWRLIHQTSEKFSDVNVATANQTVFISSFDFIGASVDVFLNGAKLISSEYSITNSTTITLVTPAKENDIIEIVIYKSLVSLPGPSINVITANYTPSSLDSVVLANTNSSDINVTLPLATSANQKGYNIKNIGSGVLTISCSGSESIDGQTNWIISSSFSSLNLIPYNNNWYII